MVLQRRRWLPERKLVVVADSGFAVRSLLWWMTHLARPVCMITRLRLEAARYKPAPPRRPHQKGRPRLKGARLPILAQGAANPKTDWQRVTVSPWYGEGRRKLEIVSGTAVWRHSGQPVVPIRWVLIRDPKGTFKTQALLCTALAILRTTPALLGLFSLVTLLAHQHVRRGRLPTRQAAWYTKAQPTFSDALAVVREHLWRHLYFDLLEAGIKGAKSPETLWNRLIPALSYTP